VSKKIELQDQLDALFYQDYAYEVRAAIFAANDTDGLSDADCDELIAAYDLLYPTLPTIAEAREKEVSEIYDAMRAYRGY